MTHNNRRGHQVAVDAAVKKTLPETRNPMAGIHSRALKLSLSVAGLVVLILFVGTVCVPEQLRADAASRMVSLGADLDAALTDAWHFAFPAPGADHSAVTSTHHKNGGFQTRLPLVSARAETPSSAPAGASSIDINAFGAGSFRDSFTAGYGAGAASDSMAGLLRDILNDESSELGRHADLETLAASYMGTGSALGRFAGGGSYSASADASAGGMATAGVSRSVSTPSHGRNAQRVLGPASVNPNPHHAYAAAHQNPTANQGDVGHGSGADKSSPPDVQNAKGSLVHANQLADAQNAYRDAHRGQVGDLESGFGSGSGAAASASEDQVESSGMPGTLANAEPGSAPPIANAISDGSSVSDDGGNADPTTIDPIKQLLSGLDHPLQGDDHHGSVFQTAVHDGTDSGSGERSVLDFNDSPPDGSHPEDNSSIDKPSLGPDPNPGFLTSVPEPYSLTLLSLALGTVILWRSSDRFIRSRHRR